VLKSRFLTAFEMTVCWVTALIVDLSGLLFAPKPNAVSLLRREKRECSKSVIPRRNDEESASGRGRPVLKSRFLAALEMT